MVLFKNIDNLSKLKEVIKLHEKYLRESFDKSVHISRYDLETDEGRKLARRSLDRATAYTESLTNLLTLLGNPTDELVIAKTSCIPTFEQTRMDRQKRGGS